jgi:hypothetical protein
MGAAVAACLVVGASPSAHAAPPSGAACGTTGTDGATAAASSSGVVRDGPYGPAAGEDQSDDQLIAELHARFTKLYGSPRDAVVDTDTRRQRPIVVPVWVHVITAGRAGDVPEARVRRQIAVLNAAFGGRIGRSDADTHIAFRLAGVDRTNDAVWFRDPYGNQDQIKDRLRRGGATTLNIYLAKLGLNALAFTTFPQWYAGHPRLDGEMVDYRTLPGGSLRHYNRGYTAVHETGHWFGLLHTFTNGCAPPGDDIADTPDEGQPTIGCPVSKNTCPDRPGADPIHNFMDYSDDDCMNQFTPDQGRRMRAVWFAFRVRARR